MQDWMHSVGINPLTDKINSLIPGIHLDLFVCPYGRDSEDMGWDTGSCRRLYWDMTPTHLFETLSSLGPDNLVTFDWPDTSEATDCFPAVYEQDPSIWMNCMASSHCRAKSGFLVLLNAVSEKMTVLSTVETESKPGWLTSWFPTPLATTTPSSCLSLGIGSWKAWAPCTITHMVRLLAVLACICSVKGISWSRKSRRLCCHLSGEPFFTGSHHIGMSILGIQPEFLLIVRTPFCSQKLHI